MGNDEAELWSFLEDHLRGIYDGDPDKYRATTHEDLSLYEWFVTPPPLGRAPFPP